MTSRGNSFYDFPEIVPTSEITTKIEKTFLVISSVAVGRFLNGPSAAARQQHPPYSVTDWLIGCVRRSSYSTTSPVSTSVLARMPPTRRS